MINKIKHFIYRNFPESFRRMYNLYMLPKRFNMIYIRALDSLGGSFKDTLCSPSFSTQYANLVSGLDDTSKHIVDVVLLRIKNYPEEKHGHVLISNRTEIVGGLLDVEKTSQKKIRKSYKKYKLPLNNSHEDSVFYFKHGLRNFDAPTISYIQEGDFVDCGAFIGDSILVFSEYCKKKMYAIEMSSTNIAAMKKVLHTNAISNENYSILQYGLTKPGDKREEIIDTKGGIKATLSSQSIDSNGEKIVCATLDDVISNHNIFPRFIKADIEGAGLNLIEGAIESILKYRPVLALAIYHNPTEFFEIKTFLESKILDYTYIIDKLTSSVSGVNHQTEVYLFAFPKEIYKV